MENFLLTRDQIVSYRKNGYLIIPEILNNEQCDRIYAIFNEYAPKIDPEYKGIMNLDREDYRIRHLMCYYKIIMILDALLDAETIGLQCIFLFKKAGSSQAWNPHQDNAYARAPHGMYVTANIPLADQDKENGCMFIYPGSHLEPLLPAELFKSWHEQTTGQNPGHDLSKNLPLNYERVDIPMKKGSLLILHGNVAHGSYPNKSSDRDRPMVLMPYGAKGISQQPNFLPGKTAERKEISVRPLRYEL
ncbi:MAG: hypothetical protein A3B86_02775 [Candidatus Yanofskybacteria bacterium RIFCSPHIGHO2_02_FULL_38_22b]|uniref:Phytanoyl-CoA dioxygenase n=1 Tax=Candidatus Yanofskybacteria bacterium RIFCSPHIGHO2_02_FULL_38_22b TaxID=1802673 RepID=A0A1F8F675_9BACT|nr:MAG: hypothetical protein A2816_03080 [Candidatus Yanofskybacteria bacterium RIFCSPHIGHO2_01_FULL_39_44]OGN07779.1 MAG: hypothetical protein A3B86_02775 [Candidatus Yanofskybacteria bacterium RIFCSPHIGHO2_02_FULL_38_22b]OGN20662.1 MAG: hypothetical protein A2910_02610 [Candidatus Yanofskybacteria bacterium RIFCSPLOWO2_01_FULL_39_28]